MRWTLGPSGLMRLAAMTALGLSLLLGGCASARRNASHTVVEGTDAWTPCPRGQSAHFTVLCLKH